MDWYRTDGLYRECREGTTPEGNQMRTMRNIEKCRVAMRRELRLYGTQGIQYRVHRKYRMSTYQGGASFCICRYGK